jgi:acyl carrier protein
VSNVTLAEIKQILEIAIDQDLLEITPDSHLYEQLGMDSMGAVAMVIEVQRRFGIRIHETDIPRITTVRELIESIAGIQHATRGLASQAG